jgi:hypothetical protein
MDSKNVTLRGKCLYAFPHVDWKLPMVMKKADPYHATLRSDLNSSVILGIAVETIVFFPVSIFPSTRKGYSATNQIDRNEEHAEDKRHDYHNELETLGVI